MNAEAPINKLLSDDGFILIFAGVAAEETKHSALNTILQISFVCRRWRSVALSFPELWSNVCLEAPKWHLVRDHRRQSLASKVGLLKLQLNRAGGYRLSVTVDGQYFMDGPGGAMGLSCIDLIHKKIRRWRSLNLSSAELCPKYMHHHIGNTPSFDSLEVLTVSHTLLEHFYKLGIAEPEMPLLRTFYTRFNRANTWIFTSPKMSKFLGAWSRNIDTIICENALCWFSLFRKARSLHIIITLKRQENSFDPMPGLSQMPGVHHIHNITSLTFDINVDTHNIRWFGEHFRFPNLLHLKILYHKDGTYGPAGEGSEHLYMRYPFCASFIENLLQFSPSLSSLTLDRIPMRMTQVLAILAPLTSLTRLVMHEPVPCLYGIPMNPLFIPYYPISPRFIEALSSDAYFLPHLKSLELLWRHKVNEGALLEMLERRHQMNLEKVSLGTRYPEPEITEEARASLDKFQEIGLRVQVLNVEI